ARILKDVGMETKGGRVVLKSEPIALKGTANILNLGMGEVVPQDWSNRIAEKFKEANALEIDTSMIEKGLKRASSQFINSMSTSLQWLQETETRRVGDYMFAIGSSLFSSFDRVINNTLPNQMERAITSVCGS